MKNLNFKSYARKIIAVVLCMAILITTVLSPETVQAASGSFTGGEVCTGYRLKIKYSESAKDSKNNTSKVKATTKPAPSGGLNVSNIKQTSASLSWGAVTGAKSYKTYLNGSLKASGLTARSYSFTGLVANTSYKFGVCATGTSGDSSITSSANYITLPNVPGGLKVSEQTDDCVTLNWSHDNGGNAAATTFNIYRDDVLIGSSNTTDYTDTAYENTDSSYTVSATTSAGTSAKASAILVNHVPVTIELSAVNNSTYATVTPKFSGGLNRNIDYSSLKWAYGNQNAEYFADNGHAFTGSFSVLQNGTYTVFVKDTSQNSAVATVTISDMYAKSTAGACVESFTDLSVDSVGIPVEFVRTYNSMHDTDGVFEKSVIKYVEALYAKNHDLKTENEIYDIITESIELCDRYVSNYYFKYSLAHNDSDLFKAKKNVKAVLTDSIICDMSAYEFVMPEHFINEKILMNVISEVSYNAIFKDN